MSKNEIAKMPKISKNIAVTTEGVFVDDPALKNMIAYVEAGKYDDAVKWIKNKQVENEQIVTAGHKFDAYPADGAHAFTEVLKATYGWVEQLPIPSFWGDKPPQMLTVETSHDASKEVPWGWVTVPNIEGKLHLGATQDGGMWKFQVTAQVRKKHLHLAKELAEKTREYLKTGSIYKGKPVRLEWKENAPTMFTDGESGFDTPRFMPPSGYGKDDLILPRATFEEVNATIFSLIEKADMARRMGVPTKRLILAAGPYGTGKTLTATVTAELCRKHGRTFLYLREVEHLADAIYFAQQYAPACVFAEDIDRVKSPDMIDKISNTIDGIDTKNIDVLFILTTNHVDQIPKKFLRSGRSDMIIKYTPPDMEAAARLIMKYGGSTLAPEFSFDDALKIAEPLAAAEMIPASIREVVERSKLFALAYDRSEITNVDLARASHGVLEQCAMLKDKRPSLIPDHMEEVGTLVRMKDSSTTWSTSSKEFVSK